MSYHRRDIEKTTAYLCDNAGLKTAIGLDENALLEPHYLGVGEHNLNYWFEEVKTEEPVDEHVGDEADKLTEEEPVDGSRAGGAADAIEPTVVDMPVDPNAITGEIEPIAADENSDNAMTADAEDGEERHDAEDDAESSSQDNREPEDDSPSSSDEPQPERTTKYVLRVNVASQPFHDDQVAYEFSALQTLEESERTPKPLYLDNSPDAPGKGAMVIEYCDGDELDFDHLRPGDLRCAAQIMADVHATNAGEHCTIHRPMDPLQELFDECMQRFETYRRSAFEERRITKWTRSFISVARKCLETKPGPKDCWHVINTETLPSHFLIPAESAAQAAEAPNGAHARGRFCDNPGYFIDWERPIIGEVAQDVAYFVSPTTTFWDSDFLFPPSQIDSFVRDYWRAVDGRFERGNFDERFQAYRVMTALRSVTWCCRALIIYGDNSKGHRTGKTARKLPAYLSEDFMHLLAEQCFGF